MKLGKEQTWDKWLRAIAKEGYHVNWKPTALGMLTGQDSRALTAIAACWELYACSDDMGREAALEAVRSLLPAMQPKCHFFARELIAKSMNWGDRDHLWMLVTTREVQ